MAVKPQHIYGSYTFSWKKANQSHTHHKITNSEAMHTNKLQVQQNLTWKLQIQQTTLLTHCFVLITTSKCGIEDS